MTFGQSSGPPASDKQVRYLLALVEQAGHRDFRDARGPLALTQRQARGKFTRSEASELIDRMLAGGDDPPDDRSVRASTAAGERQAAERGRLLAGCPAEELAAELERRGWRVTGP